MTSSYYKDAKRTCDWSGSVVGKRSHLAGSQSRSLAKAKPWTESSDVSGGVGLLVVKLLKPPPAPEGVVVGAENHADAAAPPLLQRGPWMATLLSCSHTVATGHAPRVLHACIITAH